MRRIVHPDANAAAQATASLLAQAISAEPALRVCLAAGRTFIPIYEAFVALARRTQVALDRVVWIQLDDYAGLSDGDPRTFRAQLEQVLLDPLGIAPQQRLLLQQTDTPHLEIARHAAAISAAGGIGLQLLGLGANGHLAFNEPGSTPACGARVVELATSTQLKAQASFSPAPSPRLGMTLGLKEIAAAGAVILAAVGDTKAAPLAEALDPQGDPAGPFAALLGHSDLTIITDNAAARLLRPVDTEIA